MKKAKHPGLTRPALSLLRAAVILSLTMCAHGALALPDVYVDSSANGANTGASWGDAYTDLQSALAAISAGEIWVAGGSYKPGISRADTFQLRNNVALYGGFAGTETALEQRDLSLNDTILDGDLLGDDYFRYANGHAVWSNAGDNSHHVVTANDTDTTAVLDGFVIAHGWAYSTGHIDAGGGLLIRNGSPTISNTTIDGSSGSYGGGAYIDQGSAPVFSNCEFFQNYSDIGYGGAMNIASSSHPIFSNCHFEGNAAIGTQSPAGYGGALYVGFGSTASITGSTFIGNMTGYRTNTTGGAYSTKGGAILAGGDISVQDSYFINNRSHNGGAIYAFNGAKLINNVFNGNRVTTAPGTAGGGYGGALILTGPSTVINNTIANNNASEGTGGLIASVAPGESVQIKNTILWGNTVSKYIAPGENPLPVSRNQLARGGNVSVSDSILEGLYEPIPGEDPVDPANFPRVLDADPLFQDPEGLDADASNDLDLGAGSPAIDAGNNGAVPSLVVNDISGELRFQDDPSTVDSGIGVAPIVDMGAYEVSGIAGDNIAPIAVAGANPLSGEAPLYVEFNAAASSDPDGVIVAYHWQLANGNSSSAVNPGFEYTVAGVYTVTLTVTDDAGAQRSDSLTISVTETLLNQPPIASLSVDKISGAAPLLVELDGSLSTDDSLIVAYDWDFGDASAPGSGDTIKHTYSEPGTYTATLTVIDDEGAIDTASIVITVDGNAANTAPVADTSATATTFTINKGKTTTVTLDGSNSSDSDGSIVAYSWHQDSASGPVVGAGAVLNLKRGEGTYTFLLSVTDDQGASNAAVVTLTVGKSGGGGGGGPKCNKKNPC
ncbi:MAG: PKD domain-containing protein [Gammaproteobacteria bacterium]|nr:PKD domain-containing protein [Gammaproteobacteria bacterium]MBQ0840269.1 PKD domain-containing protein [Gammaproteobacteria bacterium]